MYQPSERTDNHITSRPTTADGWAAQLASDRNNYQKGTHEQLYRHDLIAAQSFVSDHFGNLELTGTQDGHLVGIDRKTKQHVSLSSGGETVIGAADNGWKQTASGHQAKLSVDGSGLIQVGQQDRSGQDLAKSILKDRGIANPSDTQAANFQRDILLANGRKVNDLDWFKHLKPGQVIKVPAGEHTDVRPSTSQTGAAAAADAPLPAANPTVQPQVAQPADQSASDQPQQSPTDQIMSRLKPISQIVTDAANLASITAAKVDKRNQQLDAAYKFLQDHRTPTQRFGFAADDISSALLNPDYQLSGDERQGLTDLHTNFTQLAKTNFMMHPIMTDDDFNNFKKQQEDAAWAQAAKDHAALTK